MPRRTRAQHIAVADNHFPAVQFEFGVRAVVQCDAAFVVQVPVGPDVVVAAEKVYGNSAVGQLRELAQQPREEQRVLADPLP